MYKLPKFKDYVDQPVKYIQRKMDGHMYHIIKDQDGWVTCVTKNGKDKTEKILAVKHISLQLSRLPTLTHLMVELHCPGELATTVAHMMAHGDQHLKIAVFAAPTLAGHDMRNLDLRFVQEQVEKYGLTFVPVTLLPHDFTRQQLLDEAIKYKQEGWVLKKSHMEGWYKLKPVKTIDAVVMDITESDSDTYKGHMKAVKLGLYKSDRTVHDLGECGGGFSKEFKLSLSYTDMAVTLLGRVCEVAYQSVTAHKKLQFPRFIRWRTDKDAVQCTMEQLS